MTPGSIHTGLVHRYVTPGKAGPAHRALRYALRSWLKLRTRKAPSYRPPTDDELGQIEAELSRLGIEPENLHLDPNEFAHFIQRFPFPPDYHGGIAGGVYEEKLLEHFVAWKLLGLEVPGTGPYVDIAACASPWARILRDAHIEAYAIDLNMDDAFAALPFYREEDATRTTFADESIARASLQCAFEMFGGNDDRQLMVELGRILAPGGRVVISPLYMHTHPCFYQTPEFFGSPVGDAGATAYIRRDAWGVAASRKYSPETLRSRVWDTAQASGLKPRLFVLRNRYEIGSDIYLHFILVLDKTAEESK